MAEGTPAATEPTLLLVPASVMPVAAEVGLVFGNDDQVEGSRGDRVVAARTDVGLPGRVGLDRCDRQVPKRAHRTTPNVTAKAPTTRAMSRKLFDCGRNGLKPMADRPSVQCGSASVPEDDICG